MASRTSSERLPQISTDHHGGGGAVLEPETSQHVLDMPFDGSGRDAEDDADLSIGLSFREPEGYLQLPRTQRGHSFRRIRIRRLVAKPFTCRWCHDGLLTAFNLQFRLSSRCHPRSSRLIWV